MNTTRSQKALARTITEGLREREIVGLWGNPNGKTHIHHVIKENFSIGIDGKMRSTLKPRHSEDYTIDILEGVEVPIQANEVSITRIKRQVLHSYGEKTNARSLDLHRLFIHLLLDLDKSRIVPCLAMDEIEMLPRRGYSLIKLMNEIRERGKRIGLAALLSGNFSKRQMPPNFFQHIKEVQIGKVTAEEVEEFIMQIAPGYHHKFTPAALRKLGECESTLQMSRVIKTSVDFFRTSSDSETIGTEIVKASTDRILYSKHKLAA